MSDTEKARRPRCPRCRKAPVRYQEIWTGHYITFEADAEGRPEQEGYLFDGAPSYVTAICSCGHVWKLRGVLQIIDLEQQPEAPPRSSP